MEIYITQLIYIKPGQENNFHQFEDITIPTIARYKGQLLLRLRPQASDIVETSVGEPYEVHLVRFDSENDFEAFKQDEERKKFLHLKEQSIEAVLLVKGNEI